VTSVTELLAVAVDALGGSERTGQIEMAEAVAHAFESGEHLAVQAGTGTGKSLAYLVPAILRAVETGSAVVVSTATIALQRQLVERDLPRLVDALEASLPRRPRFAILKGRSNYLCLNKIHNGPAVGPDGDDGPVLFEPSTAIGRDVARLTAWSSGTETGDRDELTPGVPDRSWSQVSVTARECLGVARCPFGMECFAEKARGEAARADVVVTNHALLAIDALADAAVLPDHDLLVVDEAHELVDRVTAVASAELSATGLGVVSRRIGRLLQPELVLRFENAVSAFGSAVYDSAPGRIDRLDERLALHMATLRDAADAARREIESSDGGLCGAGSGAGSGADSGGGFRAGSGGGGRSAAARAEAVAALDEIVDTCARILVSFNEDVAERTDVVWLEQASGSAKLRVAPLSVAGLLRSRVFGRATAVLTSATLTIGGSFDSMAEAWGLAGQDSAGSSEGSSSGSSEGGSAGSSAVRWRGLDVGSPFSHAKSGILYIARHLPAPGRDGAGSGEQLTEIAELVTAARGRTLGLFSSMRAARTAAEEMRERLSTPVLCQGDDATGALVEQFAADPETSLFGTLSLWQGVDVPGPSLSLVIIDRIPFPRPDDPLLTARQRAVAARGGNGFMAVAASHAALLLAQGAGRLLRRIDDKGVVAVLDSRMATARYGRYLRDSLPPFWVTTDRQTVLGALERLTRQ
jgi:ATP-dependent DNA helicase DinG